MVAFFDKMLGMMDYDSGYLRCPRRWTFLKVAGKRYLLSSFYFREA